MRSFIHLLLLFFFSPPVSAAPQESPGEWNLDAVCQGRPLPDIASPRVALTLHPLSRLDLIVMDRGFCGHFNESRLQPEPEKGLLSGYKIRLYLAHSFTRYFNSDIQFRSSRYSVDIQDYSWAERGSREYFLPTTWIRPGNNPFQVLDEPTNIFTVSIEKDGNEYFLSVFHPKFYQAPEQRRHITGTIDGVAVDEDRIVNEPIGANGPYPGQSRLVTNQFTYGQMNYEFGYGRRIRLIQSRFGNLTYIPRVGLGFMVGENSSVMFSAKGWWDLDSSRGPLQFQGYGGSVGNRIEINSRNDRIGVFYENRLGVYDMTSAFFDGTQHFKLMFLSNNVGLNIKLYTFKKKGG